MFSSNSPIINKKYLSFTEANRNIYIVKKGDSLWKIARTFNTTVEYLMKINGKTTTVIYEGEILKLKPSIDEDEPSVVSSYSFNTTYNNHDITVNKATAKQYKYGYNSIIVNNYAKAKWHEIKDNLDPKNCISQECMLQFIVLSKYTPNIKENILRSFLGAKLENFSSIYMEAAKEYNINPVYLAMHSALETSHGKSKEAAKGEITSSGKRVYNFYAIGVYDNKPKTWVKLAEKYGWFSKEKAIWGGAAYISRNYIHDDKFTQNTLYRMKWDHRDKNFKIQYATDVLWPRKIANKMKQVLDKHGTAFNFDLIIPRFKN